MISDIKIGITGLPGAGKTTALLSVIDMLKRDDLKIGGMLNEPIMDGRYRVGFSTKNFMTGDTETFALNTIESKIMVGKIGVDISKLESVGVSAIKQACEECDIIIIDEVGKIEVEIDFFVVDLLFKAQGDADDHFRNVKIGTDQLIVGFHSGHGQHAVGQAREPLDLRRNDLQVILLQVVPRAEHMLTRDIVFLENRIFITMVFTKKVWCTYQKNC